MTIEEAKEFANRLHAAAVWLEHYKSINFNEVYKGKWNSIEDYAKKVLGINSNEQSNYMKSLNQRLIILEGHLFDIG